MSLTVAFPTTAAIQVRSVYVGQLRLSSMKAVGCHRDKKIKHQTGLEYHSTAGHAIYGVLWIGNQYP